jgi:dTMP kinase
VPAEAVPGRLVVIEGPDRVGKSTLVGWVAGALTTQGHEVIVSREPGGDPLAEQVRALVLGQEMDPWTECLLFLAARARHVAEVVAPALARGRVVLLDRYSPSTLVYQGDGLGDEVVAELLRVLGFPEPMLTVVLDRPTPFGVLDVDDRFEAPEAWARHRARYLTLAERHGWRVLTADASVEELGHRLLALLDEEGVLG